MSCAGQSSDLLTSATQITDKQCVLLSVIVTGGTVVIYDSSNSTTTGKRVVAKIVAAATASEVYHVDGGIACNNGMYLTITAGDCVVGFRQG